MEYYERSEEEYKNMIERLKRNLSIDELKEYQDMFERYIIESKTDKIRKYWEYELKTIRDCLK